MEFSCKQTWFHVVSQSVSHQIFVSPHTCQLPPPAYRAFVSNARTRICPRGDGRTAWEQNQLHYSEREREVMNSQLVDNAAEDKEISVLRGCQKMSLPICFLSSDTASANLISSREHISHRDSWGELFVCTHILPALDFFSGDSYSLSDCCQRARGEGGGWRGGSKLSESVKNEMRRVWNCKETLVMNDVN